MPAPRTAPRSSAVGLTPMPEVGPDPSAEWTGRVGSAWAEQWHRTDRSFGALTDRLLAPDAVGRFGSALDIGCGAGELVERLARTRPAAHVTGVDVSAELIAVAHTRTAHLSNAHFEEGDAAWWRADPAARPDLLISRHGVMFFADPIAAFAHLRAEASPEARLRFSCFRARTDNAWAAALASVLPPPATPPDPLAPGPFAFADPDRVRSILAAAGWTGIAFEPVDYAMVAGEGGGAVEEAVAYFQRIGPAARAIAERPEEERPAIRARLLELLTGHHREGRVSLPSAAWIVTAIASETSGP